MTETFITVSGYSLHYLSRPEAWVWGLVWLCS